MVAVDLDSGTTSSSSGSAAPPSPATRPRRSVRRRWLTTALPLLLLLFCSFLSAAALATAPTETLNEQLLLKSLPDGRVLSSFEFTLTSTSSAASNFHLLPRSLLQPIQHFGVREVHLALNSGRWRYDRWGSPVSSLRRRSDYTHGGAGRVKLGEESVGAGAELWAHFDGEAGSSWKGLTSALAGLFCTSLDALDERQTVRPHFVSGETLHAALPSENVCTENLTPFIKLLPCRNSAGLAALLNPLSLFRSDFHGLAVHVVRREEAGWEVKLTFTSVFAPAVTRDVSVRDWSLKSLFGRSVGAACPLAEESVVRVLKPQDPVRYEVSPLPEYPECSVPGDERRCTAGRSGDGYTFFPALDELDETTDSLAAAGLLAFESPQEQAEYDERLRRRWAHHLELDGEYIYNLASTNLSAGLDVRMTWPHEARFSYPAVGNVSSGVEVERTLLGSGQERTTLQVVLTNNDPRLATRVLWYETLGWFVEPLLHTLSHSTELLPSTEEDELLRSIADFGDPLEEVVYQPARGERPFVMESVVRLPASSKTVLRIELRKGFVRYSRHPPDAHRGFDLMGGLVWVLAREDPREALKGGSAKRVGSRGSGTAIQGGEVALWQKALGWLAPEPPATKKRVSKEISKTHTRIYTLPRLVELATPDFSFVYTNIIFTSTVIALFFGSSLNSLLRTFNDFVL